MGYASTCKCINLITRDSYSDALNLCKVIKILKIAIIFQFFCKYCFFACHYILAVPTPPEDVVLGMATPTSVVISWQPPARPNGVLLGYQLTLVASAMEKSRRRRDVILLMPTPGIPLVMNVSSDTTSANITNLGRLPKMFALNNKLQIHT